MVKQFTEQGDAEQNSEILTAAGPENSVEEGKEKNNRQEQQEPKAITMAEQLKCKASLQKKTKLGDGSNIKAEDR